MHLDILKKKGFLPPVNLHSKGMGRTIRPTFPKEAATLPAEMSSGKRGVVLRSKILGQEINSLSPPIREDFL